MAVVFINGKRTMLPDSVVSADQIVRVSGDGMNRGDRAVYRTTGGAGIERMAPYKHYEAHPGDDFLTGPDRVKGSVPFLGLINGDDYSNGSYFGHKEKWRRDLIYDQVKDISENILDGAVCELDTNCDWVVFPNFVLPEAWARVNPGKECTRLMLVIPNEFPDLPTNGFYLPNNLVAPFSDSHFFEEGYGGAYGELSSEARELRAAGWKWYCMHITPGTWRPAPLRRISDWRRGDNLYHILALAREALTNPVAS